jgi:protein-S-isoprenylcysteine O-methyltransferase Ste14
MMVEWATLPLLLLYPVMVAMYVRLAKREEADMLEEFGDEYRNYRETTKMFIPYII